MQPLLRQHSSIVHLLFISSAHLQTMGNEEDPLAKPDYLRNVQYSARDLAVPVFSKPQEIRGPGNRVIRSIAYSPNGKKVATGCDIRGLRVWDARDKMDASTAIHLPTAGDKASPHAGNVKALAWSPADDNILASGCAMNSNSPKYTMLVIWDITCTSLSDSGDLLRTRYASLHAGVETNVQLHRLIFSAQSANLYAQAPIRHHAHVFPPKWRPHRSRLSTRHVRRGILFQQGRRQWRGWRCGYREMVLEGGRGDWRSGD